MLSDERVFNNAFGRLISLKGGLRDFIILYVSSPENYNTGGES